MNNATTDLDLSHTLIALAIAFFIVFLLAIFVPLYFESRSFHRRRTRAVNRLIDEENVVFSIPFHIVLPTLPEEPHIGP
jgi:hypothetical protein